MEAILYTLTGIVLYLLADWILKRIEAARGAPFEQRTLVFFAILLALALTSFAAIRRLFGGGG